VQVEQDARAEQPWHERGEDERIRQRMHLDELVAPSQVEGGRERCRRCEEQAVVERVTDEAAAASAQRQTDEPQPSAGLTPWLAGSLQAEDVHFAPRLEQRRYLAAHPGIDVERVLPDDEDPRRGDSVHRARAAPRATSR
jgi:hypothetical protein